MRWLSRLFRRHHRPSLRGNMIAFKAGERAFKKSGGASPALIAAMKAAIENDRRLLDGGSGF